MCTFDKKYMLGITSDFVKYLGFLCRPHEFKACLEMSLNFERLNTMVLFLKMRRKALKCLSM